MEQLGKLRILAHEVMNNPNNLIIDFSNSSIEGIRELFHFLILLLTFCISIHKKSDDINIDAITQEDMFYIKDRLSYANIILHVSINDINTAPPPVRQFKMLYSYDSREVRELSKCVMHIIASRYYTISFSLGYKALPW
jgi:hypothetical protein